MLSSLTQYFCEEIKEFCIFIQPENCCFWIKIQNRNNFQVVLIVLFHGIMNTVQNRIFQEYCLEISISIAKIKRKSHCALQNEQAFSSENYLKGSFLFNLSCNIYFSHWPSSNICETLPVITSTFWELCRPGVSKLQPNPATSFCKWSFIRIH